ncbi:helix-turn-helix domain-containing protein, partial [Enterococcus durans]
MDRRSIQKYYDFLVHSPLLTYEDRENILISKYGLGYKFVGTKKDYKALTKQVLQSNPFFELFETLFLENEINLVKFAYENYVSESTVRKRLYELEKLLDPIGFTLKKNKGYVYLEGNEARIRYFMVTFFWRIFSGLHWPFPNISEEKCTQISRNIYQAAQIEVNEIEIRITTYLLATNVVRYRKCYRIDPDTLRLEPPLTVGDQLLFSQLIDKDTLIFKQLQNELDQHYVFDSTEINFIYYWLQSSLGSSFSDEQLNDYFPQSFSQSKTTTDLKKLIIAISKDSD